MGWYVQWLSATITLKKQVWASQDAALEGFVTAAQIAKATASAVAGDVPDKQKACTKAASNAKRALEDAYTSAVTTSSSTLARTVIREKKDRASMLAAAKATQMQAQAAAERA